MIPPVTQATIFEKNSYKKNGFHCFCQSFSLEARHMLPHCSLSMCISVNSWY